MPRGFWPGFLLLLLLGGEAVATRVFHQRLEEVLNPQTPVIRARVAGSQVLVEPTLLRVVIEVAAVEVVNGEPPSGNRLTHQFSTQLERTVDGKTVRVSPIRQGSGLEQRLAEGESYYFLLDSRREWVLRVEPDSSGPQIRQLLGLP